MTDLGPLAGLTAIQSLNLTGTQVTDLGPLAGLTALRSLDLDGHASDRPGAARRADRGSSPSTSGVPTSKTQAALNILILILKNEYDYRVSACFGFFRPTSVSTLVPGHPDSDRFPPSPYSPRRNDETDRPQRSSNDQRLEVDPIEPPLAVASSGVAGKSATRPDAEIGHGTTASGNPEDRAAGRPGR